MMVHGTKIVIALQIASVLSDNKTSCQIKLDCVDHKSVYFCSDTTVLCLCVNMLKPIIYLYFILQNQHLCIIGLSFKYERTYLVLSLNLISIWYVNRRFTQV